MGVEAIKLLEVKSLQSDPAGGVVEEQQKNAVVLGAPDESAIANAEYAQSVEQLRAKVGTSSSSKGS